MKILLKTQVEYHNSFRYRWDVFRDSL